MEEAGDGAAANLAAPFEHRGLDAAAGEVIRRGEAVVTPADDDRLALGAEALAHAALGAEALA
jgi:hypothetical protein